MSCTTIYIVRGPDGVRYRREKYGAMMHASPEELFATIGSELWAIGDHSLRACCRGWYIDPAARFARVYFCDRGVQPIATWEGWDVAQLFEGRHEVAPLAGVVFDDDDQARRYLDDWRGAEAARLVTALSLDDPQALLHAWDPQRRELRHDFYYLDGGSTTISVIGHDGFVTHHGFAGTVLFAALGHGPALIDELERCAPCPEISDVAEGAWIDVRTTEIGLWRDEAISPETYEALRTRWPGWRVAREVRGRDGQDERRRVAARHDGPRRMIRVTLRTVTLLDDLERRGLLQQVTDREGLDKLLASQVVPVYAGYDPTSSSLHVGNLVPTIMLKHFQLAGHRPIVLVGGATGMIGDPSGKSDERNLLDETTLAANVAGIRGQLAQLFDLDDPKTGAALVNNYEWTRDVSYLAFLRDIGKHLTINYMQAKDSVKNRAGSDSPSATVLLDAKGRVCGHDPGTVTLMRSNPTRPIPPLFDDFTKEAGVLAGVMKSALLEQAPITTNFSLRRTDTQEVACEVTFIPMRTYEESKEAPSEPVVVASIREKQAGISYTEFSYMLLQAFDFVELAKSHGCRLQVGGSDQYGNITAGCELSHKTRGPQLFGLVAPLLLDSSGQKMGKSASGERIWLDPTRTSPFEFYQYWLKQPDSDAPRLLRMFSLRPLAEIDEILARHDADRAKRTAQRELARAMTTWVHGAAAVQPIEAASQLMFGDTVAGLSEADLRSAAATIPTVDLPRGELETGMTIVELFARSGITPSKGEARRLVEQNGAYLNHVKVTDVTRKVTTADLATETMLVLKKGKQTVMLVRLV